MKRWLRLCIAAGSLLAASCALGSYHTFRVEQIYSNADGSVQFIVMREMQGANGENLWSGRTLTGGVDSRALERPKRAFGAARNTEEAGSLMMIQS